MTTTGASATSGIWSRPGRYVRTAAASTTNGGGAKEVLVTTTILHLEYVVCWVDYGDGPGNPMQSLKNLMPMPTQLSKASKKRLNLNSRVVGGCMD